MSQLQVTTLSTNNIIANTILVSNAVTVNSSGLRISDRIDGNTIISANGLTLVAGNGAGGVITSRSLTAVVNTDTIVLTNDRINLPDFNVQAVNTLLPNTWLVGNATLPATGELGPEGTPVYKLTEDNSPNTTHYAVIDQLFPYYDYPNVIPVGTPYTVEITAKAGERDLLLINMWGGYGAFFKLNVNNAYSTAGAVSNPKTSMTYLGDGWFKCVAHIVSENAIGATDTYFSLFPYIYMTDSSGNGAYTGDGVSGLYITNCKVYRATKTLYSETVNTQIFTANGTWTKPSWATTGKELVVVHAWGGGGGGSNNTSSGRGGGGGACFVGTIPLNTFANTCNVTVGLGGTPASIAGDGGNTIFVINSSASIIVYGGEGADANGQRAGGGGGLLGLAVSGNGGGPLGGAYTGNVGGTSTFGGGGAASGSSWLGGASIFGGGGGTASGQGTGGSSIYGGAGGGGATAGNSVFGGKGSVANVANIPGGGGPFNSAGGRGEVRVWTFGPAETTVGPPIYALTANTTTLYGGDSILYTVATTNVSNGATLYYTLNNSSTAVATDFTTAVNGSVVINGGIGTFALTSNNRSYSSNTGMNFDVRTDSTTGPIVASNNTVVIRKTPTITYLGDYSQETGLGADSTVTLTSQSLGTANATRRIVVAVARYRNDSSLTPTVTVAGITATRLVGWAGNYNTTNIYIADVPTGTTGNIVVTNAVDHYNGVTITWYALYDLGSSAAVSSAEAHGSVNNRSLTLNTLNQSIVIFKSSRYVSNSPTTITIDGTAGLTTVDADVRYDNVYYFYGSAGSKNMVPEGALTVRISVSARSEIGASAIALR